MAKQALHGAVAHYLQASKLQAKVGAAHGPKKLTLVESATVPSSKVMSEEILSADLVTLAPGDELSTWVLDDLRTDHAGEVGAICIYQGILKFARDPALRSFAEHHLATEQKHLYLIIGWLPSAQFSRILPMWRIAGFLTGALPSLFGPKAVYATIEAVETFVNLHYGDQIRQLATKPELNGLRKALLDCQADEVTHRNEAAVARGPTRPGVFLRAWCFLVRAGSSAAVSVIRYI